jgi:type II secretory pathway pseudopilin PulG
MNRQRRRARSSEAGYTILELLISTAIMVTVTGAIFSLMNPAENNAQAQPEVADMQQRMRVSSDTLAKELMMAGAGPYQGPVTGSLVNFFAPILPRRVGSLNPDPTTGAGSFKTDVITLAYIPNSYSQTTISQAMPPQSAEIKTNGQPNCPADADDLCGFSEGMHVIIFDTSGNWDMFAITQVQDAAAHLQHRGDNLNYKYDSGASVTQITDYTYYLDRTTNQLKRYNGYDLDEPLVDNVVDLRFDYFGDPNPPTQPKPAPGIANCLYDVAGNYLNLPVLEATEGSLAELKGDILSDGPYCGSGDNAFDVDLLRIRKVRVTLRVQAANPALRGSDTALFMKPGKARGGDRYVPDYRLTFDITPRNLNLAR